MNLKKLLYACLPLAVLASCSEADPYMTLASKTLDVEAEGGTYTVDLASNVYYRVNNDCQLDDGSGYWAEINEQAKQGDVTTYAIKVAENTATESRTGTIRFIGDDVTPLKYTINQSGVVPRGIDPVSAVVASDSTKTTFSVFCDNKSWTATCADADVTVTPASGVGNGDVTVEFPANKKLTARTITVNVAIEGDATYAYTIEQEAFAGVLADWDFANIKDDCTATFTDDADQSSFPGNNGKYVKASTGNGKIEYYAADRTGYKKVKVACKRGVGGNGDPYVSGTIPGDYWYVTSDLNGEVIPAGTKIHFYFVTKFGKMTSNLWMLEFKDGEAWSPALPTSTVQESATEGMSGAAVDYSATVTYNVNCSLLDSSKNGTYTAVEGTFTTTKDMTSVVLRFGQAGRLGLAGSDYDGKYLDQTASSCQSRFSAQHPNDPETGAQIKQYDQHLTLEIVK